MIRISIAAASVAMLAATTLASAQEYNGGPFGIQSVYGNTYNNSYNTYRRPTYNSYETYRRPTYNSYDTYRRPSAESYDTYRRPSYDSGRGYGNTWSSYARQGYSYRCTYRCGDRY
jgi:phospholipase/lecithinase/hemolysin